VRQPSRRPSDAGNLAIHSNLAQPVGCRENGLVDDLELVPCQKTPKTLFATFAIRYSPCVGKNYTFAPVCFIIFYYK